MGFLMELLGLVADMHAKSLAFFMAYHVLLIGSFCHVVEI
jgi:hypothetical protein